MGRKLQVLLVLLSAVASLTAQDFKVVAIRSSGSREFSEAEIASASGLTINQTIGPAEFKNAADRLAATGAFAEVGYKYGPLGPGMFVEFEVQDAPELLPVRFENFVWMSDDELNAELSKRVPLFHGHLPPGGVLVDDTVAALQSILAERGVTAHAGMRMHSPAPGKPIDALSFFLEGPALLIREIAVENANVVPAADVSAALKTIVGMSYDRGVIEDSIRYKLDPLYRARGLLRAVADPPVVATTGDPKNPDIRLIVRVHEGPQYTFGRLQWTGNTIFSDSDLNKAIAKCSTGAVANMLLLVEGAKIANGLYMGRGYLESKVQLTPSYDEDKKVADYELHVVEGRQYHMGRIEIVGLDAAQCEKLAAAWKLKPGDPYNPAYETQFIRDNMSFLRGRPAKTIVTQNKDATVDVRVEF